MKTNSPYSAAFTAASMMFYEMNAVVPHLLVDKSKDTLNKLTENADILKIASFKARYRVMAELVRRFNTMPKDFWERYLTLSEKEQRLSLFFVIMKTYKLVFDFQVGVTLPKFNSANQTLAPEDLLMGLYDIAGRDEFVDGWSEDTKKKVVSTYMVILRQVGILPEKGYHLQRPNIDNSAYTYYAQMGEDWFLQACLLPVYEIENIKKQAH